MLKSGYGPAVLKKKGPELVAYLRLVRPKYI